MQELRPIADELGITMAQLALAWVLREPNVASAIVGASRPEQVEDNAAASGVELDEATLRGSTRFSATASRDEGADVVTDYDSPWSATSRSSSPAAPSTAC